MMMMIGGFRVILAVSDKRVMRARLCDSMSSVCLSVTFRYGDDIGWNTSKIISRLISLR